MSTATFVEALLDLRLLHQHVIVLFCYISESLLSFFYFSGACAASTHLTLVFMPIHVSVTLSDKKYDLLTYCGMNFLNVSKRIHVCANLMSAFFLYLTYLISI